MNRNDFQQLSESRVKEAKALLDAGFPGGAYYLAGYAVECALKACIAKRTREHDFPEKESQGYYVHDLRKLVGFARLTIELEQAQQGERHLWNAPWRANLRRSVRRRRLRLSNPMNRATVM